MIVENKLTFKFEEGEEEILSKASDILDDLHTSLNFELIGDSEYDTCAKNASKYIDRIIDKVEEDKKTLKVKDNEPKKVYIIKGLSIYAEYSDEDFIADVALTRERAEVLKSEAEKLYGENTEITIETWEVG